MTPKHFPLDLQDHINNFSVLADSPPKVKLPAIDLYEYFIDVEGSTVADASVVRRILAPNLMHHRRMVS